MKEVLEDLAKKWLKKAKYNPSQQAAEKALKAYLYYAGVKIVWGPFVRALCKEAIKFDSNFEKVLSEARTLDKYSISTRSPDALPEESAPSEVYEEMTPYMLLIRQKISFFGDRKN